MTVAPLPTLGEAQPTLHDLRALLQSRPRTRIPTSTYRLQFHAGFTFREAQRLVRYLHELGVSDIYASPYSKARAGSSHGYDVANPNTLNPEIGNEDDYRALVDELTRHGMGQVLDTVPNHMGIGDANNAWWQDVLENGPASVYADFFDIDWAPLTADIQDTDKVVLPILGDQYGRVLENGELCLTFEDDGFFVRYYDFKLPLAPESYIPLLEGAAERLRDSGLNAQHSGLERVEELIGALRQLPPRRRTDTESRQERNRGKELAKRQLAALHEDSSAFRRALRHELSGLNGRKGDPRSYDQLDELLGQQSYRLAFWRVAAEEINYRRFFDINDLAAVRVEDPQVFRATHALLLVLVRLGAVSGVRIDHPDGLRDPAGHLWRLQRSCFVELHADAVRELFPPETDRQEIEAALRQLYEQLREEDPQSELLRPIYMVVEKILALGEQLPLDWPVHGTTGYDFLNLVNGIFVERENRAAFDHLYARFAGPRAGYADLANSSRKMVMLVSLPGEINGLAYRLKRLANRDRRHRDFTLNALTFAMREFVACLPVYRTYIDPDGGQAGPADAQVVEQTTREVKRRNPRTDPTIFDFIHGQILSDDQDPERLQFVARLQQVSSPVMAKGVEDTAFYQYNRLVSLNEVGGDPDRFGLSLTAFHRANESRRQSWPYSLLASSTHDSKRSEDVRARLNALSEIPRQWQANINRWARLNCRKKTTLDGRAAPDRNDEYLLYETLIGAWPLEEMDDRGYAEFQGRILQAMLKAVKEAKLNTSWINPNQAYEDALSSFVRAVLDRSDSSPFLDDFLPFQREIAQIGMFNGLSQALLKFASPGVADVYQGNEIWDFSLVDPDNRRPVDYKLRRQLLAEIDRRMKAGRRDLSVELMQTREDGRIKLYLTHRCLQLRHERPDIFLDGSYAPLRVEASRRSRACSFARVSPEGSVAIAVAPVLISELTKHGTVTPTGEAWGDARIVLPRQLVRPYRDGFTDQLVQPEEIGSRHGFRLAKVLSDFPVALLVSE